MARTKVEKSETSDPGALEAEEERLRAAAQRATTEPAPADDGGGWSEILIPVMVEAEKLEEGQTLIGWYLGTRMVPIPSRGEEVEMHYLMRDDGEITSLWGSMALDQAFQHAMIGKRTRLTYTGDLALDGGKRLKKWRAAQQTNSHRADLPLLRQIATPAQLPADNGPMRLEQGRLDPETGEIIPRAQRTYDEPTHPSYDRFRQ